MKKLTRSITLFYLVFCISTAVVAHGDKKKSLECEIKQFTFSWAMIDECDMKPRGGSNKGVINVLDPKVHSGWKSIQEKSLSKFEKDRRAILAMAGPYRVSFDFLEIAGYTPNYKPARPYQSWGNEYVYVAEERENYISLQHIMVMYFYKEDNSISEPMVMKHWRQDWQYQKDNNFSYIGNRQWETKKLPQQAVKGSWSQSVYQVDDSPRYESYGKWLHKTNLSTWISATTWRPLPRREGSVREDYNVLEGTNRHTITPTGWVQEEENYKLNLDQQGVPVTSMPYLSKELGVNRYERIVEHDFSHGAQYWKASGPYWADVRAVWKDLIAEYKNMTIHKRKDKKFMFMVLFEKAQAIADGEKYESKQGKKIIRETLIPFIDIEE